MTVSREDRLIGCLLGGALGDAVGSHFEGRVRSGAWFWPSQLRVSDDTQLTIATCEAIIESGSVNPEAIAQQFARWFRQRRISGIGSSTLKALTELEAGGHWAVVGATGERAAGNGAAMRIAPVAFFLDPDVERDRQTIRDVCRITHRNEEAYIGAIAIVRIIRHVILGGELGGSLLELLIDALPDSHTRDRLAEVERSACTVCAYGDRYATSGYVADSVPLAILAAVRASNFSDSLRQLMQCGGDTDTIASMFGQIFGAAYSAQALPREIINAVDAEPLIRQTAFQLSRTSIA